MATGARDLKQRGGDKIATLPPGVGPSSLGGGGAFNFYYRLIQRGVNGTVRKVKT